MSEFKERYVLGKGYVAVNGEHAIGVVDEEGNEKKLKIPKIIVDYQLGDIGGDDEPQYYLVLEKVESREKKP